MANTTNFGWETPDDTDLVKDGALAMRTLGNAIDTSLVDLKGGTTGQVLSKNTNTDMDFTWTTPNVGDITEVQAGTGISVASGTGPIPVVTNTVATTFDAKGDLVAGTGADTFAKLTVGANNTVLTADSSTATGLRWAAPAGGDYVKITSADFSNQASVAVDNVFTSTYKNYMVSLLVKSATNVDADDLQLQFRYAGPTTQTTSYFGSLFSQNRANTVTNGGFNNTNQSTLSTFVGSNDYEAQLTLFFSKVGNASETPGYHGIGLLSGQDQAIGIMSGINSTSRIYTGFLLRSSSSNITGSYTVWGLKS